MAIPSTDQLSVKKATQPQDPYDVLKSMLASAPSPLSSSSGQSSQKSSSEQKDLSAYKIGGQSDSFAMNDNMQITKALQDTMIKATQFQIAEAAQGGMSSIHLAPMVAQSARAIQALTALVNPQQVQARTPEQELLNFTNPSNSKSPTGIVDKPSNFFEQTLGRPQVSQDEQGNIHYKPGGFLMGKQNPKALAEAKAMQEFTGQTPIQPLEKATAQASKEKTLFDAKMEEYKQNRQDERVILEKQLTEKYSKDNPERKQAVVADDIANFISSYESLGAKGPVGGRLGGLGASIGIGKEQRAKFEADAETLSYSFADFALNQTNRSLTEKERISLKDKILGASFVKTKGEFYGKMDAVIKAVNTRIKSHNPDAKILPDARKMFENAKNERASAEQRSKTGSQEFTTTPGGNSFKLKQ